ncbi:hypothetical protein KC320_g80 [Hortaea werneckii]|nr:hypothetical protein KC320_g80 [Hortaea werneckii]
MNHEINTQQSCDEITPPSAEGATLTTCQPSSSVGLMTPFVWSVLLSMLSSRIIHDPAYHSSRNLEKKKRPTAKPQAPQERQ